ncbi:hypothetical protein L3Q82_003891 [Scortum barcoo]|uniref:Uncharacterized protein n=1 Tax=Scortum barcoo TaxID=214431 RepID=A0ACB8X6G3_9TELE|nr:hypothetical protein L3Q82_003891 [Scortum barcoo]
MILSQDFNMSPELKTNTRFEVWTKIRVSGETGCCSDQRDTTSGHDVTEDRREKMICRILLLITLTSCVCGRVQFDKDVLREGRIRLHVSRLRTDDSGLYLCEVKTNYSVRYGECLLNVTGEQDRTQMQKEQDRADVD